jgi:putative transposase
MQLNLWEDGVPGRDGTARKKTRFSEEPMVEVPREADKAPVAEIARKFAVGDVTIYAWRKRFGQLLGGNGISDKT